MMLEPLRRRLAQRIPSPPRRQHGVIIAASGTTVTVQTDRGIVVVHGATITAVGTPVILEEIDGVWVIIGIWTPGVAEVPDTFVPLPQHHHTHELFHPEGGSDVVWVQKEQLLPLLVYPTSPPSLSVQVYPDTIYLGQSFVVLDEALMDMAGYVPTSGARYAVIYLDTVEWQYQAVAGEEGSNELPAVPQGVVPLAAVLLTPGQTAITWEHIHDLRQIPAVRAQFGEPADVGLQITVVAGTGSAGTEDAPTGGVRQFPASEDGLLDAIEYAAEYGNARIVLPPIIFLLEGTLEVPAGITLVGHGAVIDADLVVSGEVHHLGARSFGGDGVVVSCWEVES